MLLIASSNTNADIIICAIETEGDVVMTYSGSLDLTGATFFISGGGSGGAVVPNFGTLAVGGGGHDIYALSTAVASYGTGALTFADSTSGDLVQVGGALDPRLYIPVGYVSGGLLSGSATYNGYTFGSLGITPGTYEWTIPNDFVQLQVKSAVPEPSSIAFVSSLIVVCLLWRRRLTIGLQT